MTVARSLLFNILFYGMTAVMMVLCLPALLLPAWFIIRLASLWTRVSILLARVVCGIRWEIKGKEHIQPDAAIYASKHQSAWETLAFWVILRQPLYVLKKELLWIPLLGWYLKKVGNIAIDRRAGAGAMKRMIGRAKAALEQGHPIVIFPEGTRVAPGEARSFNPGIAALYTQAGLPVVPVALNSGLCWGRNSFWKKAGTITMEFLPPIAPGMPPREFLAVLERNINEATQKLTLAP